MQNGGRSNGKKPVRIISNNLILCEGIDALYFLISFLESTQYKDLLEEKNGIQIIDFGGNSELSKMLQVLRATDNFDKVKSILIIRDAETNYNDAVNQIKTALKDNDLVVPNSACEKVTKENGVSTGFLLFPTCSKELTNGTLEDLCLNIITEVNRDKAKNIVKDYLSNMKKEGYTEFKHLHKNILHSYLQAKDKFVTMKLGEAARAGAFDFKSEELNSLVGFVGEMVE